MATFDVKNYGAQGDGVTDDTAAIQAAIDDAAVKAGEVYLGPGTYVVSPDANGRCLTLAEGTRLAGVGMGASIIELADGADSATVMVYAGGDNTGASELTIDGNRDRTTGTVDGWLSAGHDDVVLNAVEVREASGIGFDLQGTGTTFEVSDSIARLNGQDGMLAGGQAHGVIRDSSAFGNGQAGFNVGGALQLLDSDAVGNSRDGIQLYETDDATNALVVDGGSAQGNGGDGVHILAVDGYTVRGVESFENINYGIHSDGSRNGLVDLNTVHDNAVDVFSQVEIAISGWNGSPAVTTSNVSVTHNLVYGGQYAYGGIEEWADSGYSNLIADNIVTHVMIGAIGVGNDTSVARGNAPFLSRYGTGKADQLGPTIVRDQLNGGLGNDHLEGGKGDDVLDGGQGADRLTGGADADVFRFSSLSDSYRDDNHSYTDRITDFDLGLDRLDLTALGFTRLGNGHGDTVRLAYDATKDLTYLKHLDEDTNGNRFELVMEGDLRGFSTSNLQALQTGTTARDTLNGGDAAETLHGNLDRDELNGLGGDDRLYGDAGGDALTGGAGADTFVYSQFSDSLRRDQVNGTQGRDMLMDFNAAAGDQIDVSSLGFTGLGDGHGTTLKLVTSSDGEMTVLKSLETNAAGYRFEIALQGDQKAAMADTSIIFAHAFGNTPSTVPAWLDSNVFGTASADSLVGNTADNVLRGGEGKDRLYGGVGNDTLVGGGGADILEGGTGNDTFAFSRISDSYRLGQVFIDTLSDFSVHSDRIDVSALGYTGLGNGHDQTLKLVEDAGRTFLRSLDADDQGRLFEVRLSGEIADQLGPENFVFAEPAQADTLNLLGVADDAA